MGTRYGILFSTLLLIAGAAPLRADGTRDAVIGHVWANEPSSDAYTPSEAYSYNRSGQPIEIARSGVGSYAVTFRGLGREGAGGNVQVTPYGSGGEQCRVSSWSSGGADFLVNVRCFDASGAAADAVYTVLLTWPEEPGAALGYVWANDESADSYTPNALYSYNGSGDPIGITRSGVGDYEVTFAGLGSGGTDFGGNVHVTAYGSSGAAVCNVRGWGSSGADVEVDVRCYDSDGNPADSRYTVLFNWPSRSVNGFGYAWANDAAADEYEPSPAYAYNGAQGPVVVSRSGAGVYAVTFERLGSASSSGGNVQVTAYGSGSESCKVSNWSSAGENFVATVRCFAAGGAPVDARFSILVAWPGTPLPSINDAIKGYVWADQASSDAYTVDHNYRYNAAAEPIEISRSATGRYSVRFRGIGSDGAGSGGNVQVTPYGGDFRCGVEGWSSSGADVVANVWCYDAAGDPVDGRFSGLFTWADEPAPNLAYVWANDETSDEYVPEAAWSYNGGGGDIVVSRSGTGSYSVSFDGLGRGAVSGGHVQVTAYGGGSEACKVAGWSSSGQDVDVGVRCFDVSGALIDVQYTVLFTWPESETRGLGYVWADEPAVPAYAPTHNWLYNGSGSEISVEREGEGRYQVTFADLGSETQTGGNVQVTAYGASSERCSVASWGSSSADFTANVRCYTPDGTPADSRFDVLVTWPEWVVIAPNEDIAVGAVPAATLVLSNYPNPFTASTTVTYSVQSPGHVRLEVFDLLGRRVATPVDRDHAPGTYEARVSADGLPAGSYLIVLRADDVAVARSVTVVK